ncbi:hypothetical protein [Brevibacterium sp. HMSC24B04]|uniref:hypothetical protein n=1 Tax=Brevibacterium sp. HMSC24B04 TaxID=1581060 RepID=UPI000AB5C0EA|nr:hypothetical protein [Brevibacterium sp. HMSC24B04]
MTHPVPLDAVMTPLAELSDSDVIITTEGEFAWVAAVLHGPDGTSVHAFPGAGPGSQGDGFSTSLPEFSLPPESVVVASPGVPSDCPTILALPPGRIQQAFILAGVNATRIRVEWKRSDDLDFLNQDSAVHFVLDDGRLYHAVYGTFVPSGANLEKTKIRYSKSTVNNYLANKDCAHWPLLAITELSENPKQA